MNRHFLLLSLICFLLLSTSAFAETETEPLANFVVHFSTGPNWQADLPPDEQPGFKAHSANLRELYLQGEIKFGARYGELGMIILAADSLSAAQAKIAEDPGIKAGIFTARIEKLAVFFPWR